MSQARMNEPNALEPQSSENDVACKGPARAITIRLMLAAWITVVAGGMWALLEYEHRPGISYAAPRHWPADTQLGVLNSHSTLVMFAHPKCPCTRATIGELARIMTACRDDVRAYAVFVKPPGCSTQPDWEQTDLWDSAAEIPGVTAVLDIDGIEANRFGAATSGFVLLYDREGELQFRGGITASRGHSGDNLGRTAVVKFISHGFTTVNNTKVYGCELGTPPNVLVSSCCQP